MLFGCCFFSDIVLILVCINVFIGKLVVVSSWCIMWLCFLCSVICINVLLGIVFIIVKLLMNVGLLFNLIFVCSVWFSLCGIDFVIVVRYVLGILWEGCINWCVNLLLLVSSISFLVFVFRCLIWKSFLVFWIFCLIKLLMYGWLWLLDMVECMLCGLFSVKYISELLSIILVLLIWIIVIWGLIWVFNLVIMCLFILMWLLMIIFLVVCFDVILVWDNIFCRWMFWGFWDFFGLVINYGLCWMIVFVWMLVYWWVWWNVVYCLGICLGC